MKGKGSRVPTQPPGKLLSLDAFLRAARGAGIDLTRRALQYYYSPRLQLLPPPVYRGGHVAYFEQRHLHRLKAIKSLQSRYRLPLGAIRELLDAVSDADIRTLAEGRAAPLCAQIVLHHLRLRNAPRKRKERALFEAIVVLVAWHAWCASSSAASPQRPSLCPQLLNEEMEIEIRQLVARIVQHMNKRGLHAD